MDVGTAKPPKPVLAEVPHALIDILDPAESYSVARFVDDALREVDAARTVGELPILVGGTGLYFRALEHGLAAMPQADPTIRAAIEQSASQRGWPALHQDLAGIDPESAAMIKPNDPQRITRALEVYQLTGKTRSAHWQSTNSPKLAGPIVKIALCPPQRTLLNAAIAERFHAMMAAGFLEEVQRLKLRPDLHAALPSIRAVGYRQLWAHLDGLTSLEAAVERGIIATRQYAKRQMTWLRSEAHCRWFDAQDPASFVAVAALIRAADWYC
jgi:tRNA dimethylallyltransferase